jgi:phosphohistidine phosphatase
MDECDKLTAPMKRLYLMRHGHSPTTSEASVAKDALRPLSERGRRDARRMAEEILKRGGKPGLILHSPLVRAVQTARAVADALKPAAGPEMFEALDNTLSADEVIEALRERGGDADEVLAIGHQPQIGEVASLLAGMPFEIRPAGLVALNLGASPSLAWSLNADELD